MEYLGKRIKKIRLQHEDSQKILAEKLNISRQVVSKWETNVSQPNIKMLKEIADLYQVDLNYFTDKDPNLDEKKQTLPILDIDTYRYYYALVSLFSVYFLGSISILITLPLLIIHIKKRKILWSIFYALLLFFGLHILMTILCPELVPSKIEVRPE